jgi:TonB family protein
MSQRNVGSAAKSGTFTGGHSGWRQGLTQTLIHHAARHAPQSLSDRLAEEWLADLATRRSAISRLCFAIGCCWATRVIAYEHQPSRVPVSSSVVAGKTLIAYADRSFGFLSLRSSTFFLVLSLHVLLLYGFMTALSHPRGSVTPDPLQNQVLKNPPPRVLPVPLPGPHLDGVIILVPKPNTELNFEPDPDGRITAGVVQEPLPPTEVLPPSRPHVVSRVQGGPGSGFPYPDDFYPELARRLEEQGIATVQVCVDTRGRLTSDPTTLQKTGSSRLDEGALKLARAGSGHYRATTEDGQPVNACYPVRIRFQLKN